MARPRLIGIDVGTTSVKAVLIAADGAVLDRFSQAHATQRPAPGHAEQDPLAWMQAVTAALDRFTGSHDLTDVAGIGLCSQVNTHVFVDAAGLPLLPAILWQDGRCAPEAAELDARVTPAEKLAWFGAPLPIDASHALSRIAHVARHHPELYARTRYVLLPKDFCTLALTGEVAADPVAAVGLTGADLNYVAPLLALVPGAAERLPPLHGFTHVVGRVRPGLPCAGVPVVVGAMDAWAGMFGVGVVADGEAMDQSGTSEIPGIVSSRVVPTPGVIVFPAYEGITMHAAPTQSGGAALAWLAGMFGLAPAALSGLAATAKPQSVPLFLPHLAGERAPVWDAESRGVFARLDADAGAPEMARAVMEGVALAVRWAFEALQASAGRQVQMVHLGGGGAQSDLWAQIRADALGKTMRRVRLNDAGTLGAAMLAGVGGGDFASIPEAVRQLVRFDRDFEPDPARAGYYAHRYEKYRALYAALKPFNHDF